jgi:hypothetical protein
MRTGAPNSFKIAALSEPIGTVLIRASLEDLPEFDETDEQAERRINIEIVIK